MTLVFHFAYSMICFGTGPNGPARPSLNNRKNLASAVELAGHILCRPILGGLHHQYVRI
jgi:hypothetical protein